jgi:enoyl-CoA hydratase/carnithine racemase
MIGDDCRAARRDHTEDGISMSDFEFPVTRDGAIARVDLGRPEEGNALTRPMMKTLAALLRELGANPEVSVITLGGRGRQFCKGLDRRGESAAGMSPYDVRVNFMGPVLNLYQTLADVPIPVIGCVHGDAIGFGSALAAACDITFAAPNARFGFTEIEHGIAPTMAICAALHKVPAKALTYLVYSAELVDAAQAVSFGLASKVLPQATFEQDVRAFTQTLASRRRLVLESIKRYQTKAAHLTPDMASEYAGTLLALVR